MKCQYSFSLFLLIFLIVGCSGSSSQTDELESIPQTITGSPDSSALETCYSISITINDDNESSNICTTKENGGYNGLGVSRFISLKVNASSIVDIKVSRISGLNPSDPDLVLYKNGSVIDLQESTKFNTESLRISLEDGDYVIELREYGYRVDSEKQRLINLVSSKLSSAHEAQVKSDSDCEANDVSTVTGRVTFDRVYHSGQSLNYSNVSQLPAQQVLVEVVCGGGIFSSTVTDSDGVYNLSFSNNEFSFVRVKAQMVNEESWDIKVVDNTASGHPVYVMDGSVFTEDSNQIRNLYANSGWGGSGYSGPRVAAPFAILDSIRKAKDKVLSVASVDFPVLNINWSPNNTLLSIVTSHYNGSEIFLLGAENSDTDEYDEHVIIHEWGHYFEDNFSRTDSIGGSHSLGDIIDFRVAFGEGFGNALSAMVTDSALYIDSSGFQQSSGFFINLENNSCFNSGWYSECSVQSVLYDIYDENNESLDTLSLGFSAIYNVMVGAQKNTKALTSIFTFTKALKDQNINDSGAIDLLLSRQSIDPVIDVYGSGQVSANPGDTDQLPVYELF